MKVTTESPQQFVPVTFRITCESKAELDAIGTIFNSAWLTEAAREIFKCDLPTYRDFKDAGADMENAEKLQRRLYELYKERRPWV